MFFFQAEDGIRDGTVTGVQTCALPILFSEALRLLETSEEDLEIYSVTLSNYASLLMHQGKYDHAEEMLTQVMELSKNEAWFTDDIYYATLNNLAIVQQRLGQYKASELSFKKLMRADSASIGTNHPDYSITLSNLGLLYIDEGRLTEAERVLKKSIDILKNNK